MTYLLDGGEDWALLKEKMMLQFERDPTFKIDDVHDLSRPQIRARVMTRVSHFGNAHDA